MLRSMTGFGRHSIDTDLGELAWELRSVNHRYLEASVRMPEELRALEPVVRERIAARLHRGKVEATLRLKTTASAPGSTQLDYRVLRSLVGVIERVSDELPNAALVDPLDVMQWPGVMLAPSQSDETMASHTLESLDAALDDLVATREREGAKTADMLDTRAEQITAHLVAVKAHRPSVVARQKQKLAAKLAELDIEHDASRIEQEMVIAAQKLDIDEELDRLAAHVTELRAAIKREGPVGRRLDFLMQEFNREANTIGSKAADLDTTGASVDIKVLIEQMREQVQNVE